MNWLRNIAVGLRDAVQSAPAAENTIESLGLRSGGKGFREFTVPTRFRGGSSLAMGSRHARDRSHGGIIPLSGVKVP